MLLFNIVMENDFQQKIIIFLSNESILVSRISIFIIMNIDFVLTAGVVILILCVIKRVSIYYALIKETQRRFIDLAWYILRFGKDVEYPYIFSCIEIYVNNSYYENEEDRYYISLSRVYQFTTFYTIH